VDVRVDEAGDDDAPAEVDGLRRGKRRLVHADAAGDAIARERERSLRRHRRLHRPDQSALEDHVGKNLDVFDHVTIGVADTDAARRFYDAAFSALEVGVSRGDEFLEWGDFSLGLAPRRARTRRAHVAFAARSRAHVDAFWRATTEAGGTDNGEPGLRPKYHGDYYGAFVLDPDANNIEAVFHGSPGRPGAIDHLSLRARSASLSARFFETVLEPLGVRRARTSDALVGFRHDEGSLWVYEGAPTQNLHFAFAAPDNAGVDAFWEAGTAAGFIDNGRPGERKYHHGYYAAFLLDPDGNNVEAVCHNR
jgi:catechol 2,3-dioxygenase-like lactoylglutathione lyase family enzyme